MNCENTARAAEAEALRTALDKLSAEYKQLQHQELGYQAAVAEYEVHPPFL